MSPLVQSLKAFSDIFTFVPITDVVTQIDLPFIINIGQNSKYKYDRQIFYPCLNSTELLINRRWRQGVMNIWVI